MTADKITQLVIAKPIKKIWTISEGRGVTLTVRRQFTNEGHIFIDTDRGTINFPAHDVTRFEYAVNAVNVAVKGHKEEYSLFF